MNSLTKDEALAVYNMVLATRTARKEIEESKSKVLESIRLKSLAIMHSVDEECREKDMINDKLF